MESNHYIQATTINATFLKVADSRCLLQNQALQTKQQQINEQSRNAKKKCAEERR
jgi:hypothetical protein